VTYYEMHAPIRKKTPAIVAGLALFLAGAIAIGGVNLFGSRVGFGFIPLLVITIWPRNANSLLSLALIFAAGLFTDWATNQILGQWALVLTVTWGVLRPELRSAPYAPVGLFFVWLATCGLALILLSISGWFVRGILPDFTTLGRQMILATVLLPIILLLRKVVARRFGEREEWGA